MKLCVYRSAESGYNLNEQGLRLRGGSDTSVPSRVDTGVRVWRKSRFQRNRVGKDPEESRERPETEPEQTRKKPGKDSAFSDRRKEKS